MRLFLSTLAIALLGFLGCATQYQLTLINSYPQSLVIELDSQGSRRSVVVPPKDLRSASPLLAMESVTDDLELRTFIIQDSSHRILNIHRFSASYLASQNWLLSVPFQVIDTIPPQSLTGLAVLELAKTNTLFHLSQEYYNSGNYTKCLQLIEGSFQTGALGIVGRRATQSMSRTEHAQEVSRFAGYCMLAYLCSKKLNRPDKASYYWKSFEQLAPDFSRYLKANDREFAE